MASKELQAKALEALVALNAATKNIRLYPPASAMVQKSVERVFSFLEAIFQDRGDLTVAESEKSLLLFGAPLTEKEQQKPQVIAFIATLLDFGIKSLAVKRGVTIEELEILLKTLSRKAEDVNAAGGLQAALAGSDLPHIVLDEKVYMAVDQDQQLVAGMDVAGEEIIKFIASGKAASGHEMERLKEMARDPAWVANVFSAGIKQLHGMGGEGSGSGMAGTLAHLAETFEALTGEENRAAVSRQVADTVVAQDDETLIPVLAKDYEGKLGKALYSQILDRMPDDQFKRIVLKLKELTAAGDRTASLAYQNLVVSEKGRQLNVNLKTPSAEDQARKKQKIMRLKAGLNSMVRGEPIPLEDGDFLDGLPGAATQLIEKGKLETAGTIAERLAAGLTQADPESRSKIYRAYKSIIQKLPEDEKTALVTKTMGSLLQWVKMQATLTPEYEQAGNDISRQAMRLMKRRRFGQLNVILGIFNDKATGRQAGDEGIRQHAEFILRSIGSDSAWDLFLNKFALLEERLREPAIQAQVLLGIAALDRLLDALESSQEMSDRVRLVRIITEIGKPAIPKICQRIETGGAWYYVRNLVALLGKIGGPEEVDVLQPLLIDRDFRIQREAVNSVYSIGEDRRGPALLAALPAVSDRKKVSMVAMLGALKYAESVDPLLKILTSKPAADAKIREQLFEKTCTALGRIGAESAVADLQRISLGKGLLKKAYTPKVREAARKALALIEKAAARKPAPLPETDRAPSPPAEETAAPEVQAGDREARIDKHVAAGETDAAVKLLFELVVEHAKNKNFKKAEALRDRLYDVDAMALTEIVKAGEIIEQEKADSIDHDHLDIWPELYDRLTSEEANALFHAMEAVSCDVDQTVFARGDKNENLYFITEGSLKLVFKEDERETLLKTYEKGDLAGHATFFTISMCSTSLIALTRVKMNVLPRTALDEWEKDFPALPSKLEDYCLKLEKTRDILKQKGLDRRKQERFAVKGKILVQLLNRKRQPLGKPFKGEFADLSEGGLSFYIITSKRDTARMLLGRRLGLKFLIPTRAAPLKTYQHGTVISVNYLLKNDYSIHVSFDDELPGGIAAAINRLKKITSG